MPSLHKPPYLLENPQLPAPEHPNPRIDGDESSPSSLCARLYYVILDAFRNAISRTEDAQHLSKLQSCGQRFKLWAAGLHVETSDLDVQLDEDTEMKDSVVLLLGLILYDLYKMYKHIRPTNLVSNNGETGEEPLSLRLTNDPQIEDHARWISSLTYICPDLQSFVIDSDLEDSNGIEASDFESEELVIELVDDIVDNVQQLYDLGPSLAWETTLPKAQSGFESERHIEAEDGLEEGVVHYLHLTQDKFSHISYQLALRLAKANWMRFQRLETARAIASEQRAALASRTIREKSHADSGYYTGSKSGTVQGQDNSAQPQGLIDDLNHMGTEYGSAYTSMDRSGAHGRLRFPVPPVEQLGLEHGKFDCTVCGSSVGPFRDKRAWRLHVVRDLAPYICPVPGCKSKQLHFDSQRSFTDHLRSCNGTPSSWRCKFPRCDTLFSELGSFQDHLQSSHGIIEGEEREHLCNAWTEGTILVRQKISCPICNEAISANLVQQSKHLGRHMIEVALLSIPNHSLDPAESEDSNPSESSVDHLGSGTDNKGDATAAVPAQKPTSEQDETTKSEETNVMAPDQPKDPTKKEKKERVVGFHDDPVSYVTRPANSGESWPAYHFEMHARKCPYCHDPYGVYRNREQLCDVGHRLAQEVCRFLYNKSDGHTYSTVEEDDKLVRVEIPSGYVEVQGLLKAVERSLRHRSRAPFVSMDRSYYVTPRNSRVVRTRFVKMETKPKSKARPRSGEIIDWPVEEGNSPQASRKRKADQSKRGSLYEKDLASQAESASSKYAVEVREPSMRDIDKHRSLGYYR